MKTLPWWVVLTAPVLVVKQIWCVWQLLRGTYEQDTD
jgi:hypothetical protein